MNNIRQGILTRQTKAYNNRNLTSEDIDFQNAQKRQTQKQNSLQNIHEHRRITFEGSKGERKHMQQVIKSDMDSLYEAKKRVEQENSLFEKTVDQKNQRYFQFQCQKQDQEQSARREYQKQVMDLNKKLVETKVELKKNENIISFQTDYSNNKQNFWRKSQDYR